MAIHFIHVADPNPGVWSSTLSWIASDPGQMYASFNNPAPLGVSDAPSKWVPIRRPEYSYNSSANDAVAAAEFAAEVNSLTALGYTVMVDEIHMSSPDILPIIGLALPIIERPSKVIFAVTAGPNVSLYNIDENYIYPVISDCLSAGVGLFMEMYPSQKLAERSGNVEEYIKRYFRGPGDEKMPYLLAAHRYLESTSRLGFIFDCSNRDKRGMKGKYRLPRAHFLDLVMRHALSVYPKVYESGISFWKWDSLVPQIPNFGPDVVRKLEMHYSVSGPGGLSSGKKRFYSS